MKKPKKLKKLKLPEIDHKKLSSKIIRRKKAPEDRIKEAFDNVPKITDETVADHREQVLSTARKYIYPLQHSRKRIVYISRLKPVLITPEVWPGFNENNSWVI